MHLVLYARPTISLSKQESDASGQISSCARSMLPLLLYTKFNLIFWNGIYVNNMPDSATDLLPLVNIVWKIFGLHMSI